MKLWVLLFSLFSVLAQAQVPPTPQEAFSQTLANGSKNWKAEGQFVVSTLKNGKPEVQNLKCATTSPVTLFGKYPDVILSIGSWSCAGIGELPRALSMVRILFSRIQYAAYHIPAMPQDPNQFRLDLVTRPTYPQMQNPRSLNANIRNQIFMDVTGEKKRDFLPGDISYYGASVSITPANEMAIEFSEENFEGRTRTTNTVSAHVKLTPVN